jgi:lipopolysaccharide transport system permease protein
LISPPGWWPAPELSELWVRRELLYFLAWRDIKIRYKQAMLGIGWAVLQPLGLMVVFSVFFGGLAGVPSDRVPYPLFAFSGLLPWQLFSTTLTQSSNSLVANEQLVSRVYFPRMLMPISSVAVGLVDFVLAFAVLIAMMFFFGVVPGWTILWLPPFILLAVATSLALSLWFSAMNVRFRDVKHAIPFLIQIWLFLTPIAYPASLVPERWKILYGLNPLAGVVEGFRWALFAGEAPSAPMLAASATAVVALLVGGLFFFKKVEQRFADII